MQPTGSVLTLTALAVAGDVVLTACQVLPLALPVLIGALYWNNVLIFWMAGGVVLFLAWLVRPSFRITGRKLDEQEVPMLHAEISRLKAALGVHHRMEVLLDAGLNAGAIESRGYFGVVGTRRVLLLGVPLLATFSREQVLAVVAHEFGHFSRRHGRLGHWLYRAREGWIEYSEFVSHSDNVLDRAAQSFAKWFVPLFSRRCFAHSRQCEYEADADASSVVGPASIASALTWIGVVARFRETRFARELEGLRSDEISPPRDYNGRFAQALSTCPPQLLEDLLQEALRAPPDVRDTHPSLPERLSALSQQPILEIPSRCAGEALLGDAWPKVLAEFDARWARVVARDWRLEHLRTRHLIGPRVARTDEEAREWPLGERLQRALALRRSDPLRGRAGLAALHASHPGDASVTFAFAADLLGGGDAAGVPLMQALAREQLGLRGAAFACLSGYYMRVGDEEQAMRWSESLHAMDNGIQAAMGECLRDAERGTSRGSSLPAAERAFLGEVLGGEPCVASAFLMESEATMFVGKGSTPLVMHTLVLVLDPAALAEREENEAHLGERYRELMQELVPWSHEVHVVKRFTTEENLPEGFQKHPLELSRAGAP